MGEVIRIEVLSISGRTLEYRDVVSGKRGSADLRRFDLETGTEAVIDIETRSGRRVVSRIIEPSPELVVEEIVFGAAVDVPAVLVNGVPLDVPNPDAPLAVGQVRTALIAFSTFRTGDRDKGRTEKRRPCVIMKIDGEHVAVCPIHGANSAVRRSEASRRLIGWRELGLRKSSYANATSVWVRADSLGALIGELGAEDRSRLGI